MNILINASNIRKSGALQVTLSFLAEVKNITQHTYLIIVSEEVEQQINTSSFPPNCTLSSLSLGKPSGSGFLKQIKRLGELEKTFHADCVFSIFAPAYWTPRVPHLAGFAYVWAINPDSMFIKRLSIKQQIKTTLENTVKKFVITKNTKYHVVEEDDVKRRLSKYFHIKAENIFVVSNTYNHYFSDLSKLPHSQINFPEKQPGQFNLVTISSNFPHKNLQIIPAVSRELKVKGYKNVYFYLTINQSEFDATFKLDANIKNLGVVAASDCPYIYAQSDALLLPTLLECFSASYPEAMIMKRPVLTSDLSFARSICGDAAIYFDPLNAVDIADKISRLINNKELYNEMVANGTKRVASFPSACERASKYIEICEQIVQKEQNNN